MKFRHAAILLLVFLSMLLAACTPEEATPLRPTVVVITSEGPYYEPFNEMGDWLTGESEHSRGEVVDGVYRLSILESSFITWTNQPRAFGDGVYEVDATLSHGPEASAFGMLLLGSSDLRTFFYCMITGDGRYDVGYCEDGCEEQESLIGGFTLAYTILSGNQTNRLRIELDSGVLTFSVNGAPVSQVRDITYSDGVLGLIGESSPYGGFEVTFDNLRVTETAQ